MHTLKPENIKPAWINILIYTQLFIHTYYIHLNILYFCVHILYKHNICHFKIFAIIHSTSPGHSIYLINIGLI